MHFFHIAVGVAFDVIDFLGIGLIPILGDVVDVIGALYFYRFVGVLGLAGLVEIIPLFDILPTFTALGIYAAIKEKRRR